MDSNELKLRDLEGPARQEVSRPSVISTNLRINGNLITHGEVHINGTIFGDVQASKIVVGEKGSVTGDIVTDTIDVHGFVAGDIVGRTVKLKATAHIIGDTTHEAITIDKGACLDGNFQTAESVNKLPEPLR